MITLGIETSCDETSCSIVSEGRVLSNEISSSVHLHSVYGGVVPEIASRYHVDYISSVYRKALEKSGVKQEEIDLVSVTSGPGLPGSLIVGISFAKSLAAALDIPVLGVSHLTGHILSGFIGKQSFVEKLDSLKYTALVVSGGHTSIYSCEGDSFFEVVGQTVDDAVGEAFDKAAKVMELGYPGGPVIEKKASLYDGDKIIEFPKAKLDRKYDLDFSFSGLKTALLYYWRDQADVSKEIKPMVSYSFQKAAVEVIAIKVLRALEKTSSELVVVGGGVIKNKVLKAALENITSDKNVKMIFPTDDLAGDNAAMIAFAGERIYKKGARSDLHLKASPSLIR